MSQISNFDKKFTELDLSNTPPRLVFKICRGFDDFIMQNVYLPRSNHTCQQKPYPSGDPVPLSEG